MTKSLEARIDALARELQRFPVRWGDQTVPPIPSTSGGGGNGDCPDCFDCLTASQATVGGCSAAPNGAAPKMTLNMGVTPFSDDGGTSSLVTFFYGSATCGSSSSFGSSSGSGCSWFSCPKTICSPSSSSGSSSSYSACGVYQLRLDLTLVSGQTVESIYIVFVSGTDWMGTGS